VKQLGSTKDARATLVTVTVYSRFPAILLTSMQNWCRMERAGKIDLVENGVDGRKGERTVISATRRPEVDGAVVLACIMGVGGHCCS
jgi:hypothetical protein